MDIHHLPVTTVILAGGLGSRIGGNKALQVLHDKPLISWVLGAVSPDSDQVLINANDATDVYTQFGYRIIPDQTAGWPGPLAGLQAALDCAETTYVMTVPCDTPFLPDGLIPRLLKALTEDRTEAAVAVAGGYRQPTIALYNKQVAHKLRAYLDSGGRKVNDWLDTLQLSEVVFDKISAFDNINTREDLEKAGQQNLQSRIDKAN